MVTSYQTVVANCSIHQCRSKQRGGPREFPRNLKLQLWHQLHQEQLCMCTSVKMMMHFMFRDSQSLVENKLPLTIKHRALITTIPTLLTVVLVTWRMIRDWTYQPVHKTIKTIHFPIRITKRPKISPVNKPLKVFVQQRLNALLYKRALVNTLTEYC